MSCNSALPETVKAKDHQRAAREYIALEHCKRRIKRRAGFEQK
jgi:hypothetical protein